MKKTLCLLFVLVAIKTNAQNLLNVPFDSLNSLFNSFQSTTHIQVKETAGQSYSLNRYWKDTSGFISIVVEIKQDKKMEGLNVATTLPTVLGITITGTEDVIKTFFNKYFSTLSNNITVESRFIHNKNFKAYLTETTINNHIHKMNGLKITVGQY